MRSKEEILKDLGLTNEYYAHAGTKGTVQDIIFAEILVDIRDAIITDCKDAMNALIDIRKLR